MILTGFFLITAGYFIIWGRIPIAGVAGPSVAGHPVLVRIAGVGILALVLLGRYTGNPTFLMTSAVLLFLLLAVALFLGR